MRRSHEQDCFSPSCSKTIHPISLHASLLEGIIDICYQVAPLSVSEEMYAVWEPDSVLQWHALVCTLRLYFSPYFIVIIFTFNIEFALHLAWLLFAAHSRTPASLRCAAKNYLGSSSPCRSCATSKTPQTISIGRSASTASGSSSTRRGASRRPLPTSRRSPKSKASHICTFALLTIFWMLGHPRWNLELHREL